MTSYKVQLEDCPCPICYQFNDEIVLIGRERRLNLPGEFSVVRCKNCGLMRTSPRPTSESIGFYYPDNYGGDTYAVLRTSKNLPEETYLPTNRLKSLFELFFGKSLYKQIPSLLPGRMLDVGCASGAFLHKMACQGWEVEGIEFSEKGAEAARSLGYKVHTGSLEATPDPKHNYDLVVAWNVIEHLHEPVLSLKKLHDWVVPGGWLAISVPNADSFMFHLFRSAWYSLHLPNHLYNFTPKTIKLVLEHSGWQVKGVFHRRSFGNIFTSAACLLQDWGYSEQLSKFFLNLNNRPAGYLRKGFRKLKLTSFVECLFAVLGQTGQMTVWAQRYDK